MIIKPAENAICTFRLFSALVVLVVTGGPILSGAAIQTDVDQRVIEQVSRFQNEDWRTREEAFYRLLDVVMPDGFRGRTELIPSALDAFSKSQPAVTERVATGLISLLERESAISRNAAVGSLTEEFENYLGDLIAATAALHDQRAADALVTQLRTGNMASKAVAAFGGRSIDRVLATLNSGDIADRIGATHTLAHMLDPTVVRIDDVSRQQVKTGLITASQDQHFAVRQSAIIGLAKLPGPDVTAVLKELAERDPYKRPNDGGPVSYPVRDAAARALAAR
jgi:hypothetical protein